MTHGQWFEFCDANGKGHCQTDLLQDLGDVVLVLEAKYTWVPDGQNQLNWLYRPVVERIWAKPVIGVVVCKTLVAGMSRETQVVTSVDDAIAMGRGGRDVVLHWLGKTTLSHGGCPVSRQRVGIDLAQLDA